MKETLQDTEKFQFWKSQLEKNKVQIQKIDEVYTLHKNNGELLFALMETVVVPENSDPVPPVCFMKGAAVCILISMIDHTTGDIYLLLVKQRRICHGGFEYEHVAGMMDRGETPLSVAIREAEEESGLELDPENIFPLLPGASYPSPGTSDERVFLFYTELSMSKEEMLKHDQKKMGLLHEHELIYTHVIPFEEAKKLITNTSGLLAVYLYEEIVRNRKG